MKAEDTKIIIDAVEQMLPDLTDVKVKQDDITGKTYFIGTTEDGRMARFEVTAKITQLSKARKVSE